MRYADAAMNSPPRSQLDPAAKWFVALGAMAALAAILTLLFGDNLVGRSGLWPNLPRPTDNGTTGKRSPSPSDALAATGGEPGETPGTSVSPPALSAQRVSDPASATPTAKPSPDHAAKCANPDIETAFWCGYENGAAGRPFSGSGS
jgi:hypothetical protein